MRRATSTRTPAKEILEVNREWLSDFQEKLYAQDRWAVLLIFQAMDAAGRTAPSSTSSGVNPQGCEVHRSSSPHQKNSITISCGAKMVVLPRRGHIGIFNRSYYEEVPGGTGAPRRCWTRRESRTRW